MKNKLSLLLVLILSLFSITSCTDIITETQDFQKQEDLEQDKDLLEQKDEETSQIDSDVQEDIVEDKILNTFDDVAKYIEENGTLPDNYITKSEARELGWDNQAGNLAEVAPGKSIGGDVFGNREGLLPDKEGRIWYEADINYESGYRGSDRIVYSNDGLIYKTTDHYKSFTKIK